MKITEKEWLNLCQSVKNEKCDCIHWDDAPVTSRSGGISHLQHILTRSAKQVGAVQLTCILVRDGENIPLSDIQITDPANLMQICFLSMFLISFYECIIPWIGQKWN